ncbi:hypothetical protein J5N97_013688 [Dioscorea zingiberensis]|uniref:DUF4005 domain-containing protein n=1 Tax=Dioscorea zingiberensis TaxID=325984 RepID=A0A9D5HJ12_9LILI|nr:hypothetical protein J5N97_013688 [Dioscorea zingiberensis]
MGRKGKWLGAVKRVFSPESKEKANKSKKKWGLGKSKQSEPCPESLDNAASSAAPPSQPVPHPEEIKLAESEQSKQAPSVVSPATKAAEPTIPSAQAVAEVVHVATLSKFSGKFTEEAAAIKIQTVFRGYLARRALRALRGLVRLKSLIQGDAVKRQATTTLRCMQTLARVQSQIRSRRIRMSEENQALQRQLLLKNGKELEKLRSGEDWDDRVQSKEQTDASLLSKHEAAIRRERAMAYAFSHQWKSSSRSANPMFTDPSNPQWGWSWLERWMAARPWETRSVTDKETSNDHASVKSAVCSVPGEITKAYARRDTISERASVASLKSGRRSPATPPFRVSSITGKIKSASPKSGWATLDDDSRSMISLQSERHRRHSIAGSSIRDDESLASSPAVPSYMAPTESARAKSRFQSPVASENPETPEKGPIASVKKRLSFPSADKHGMTSPAVARRHSGPPKVDSASMKDITIHS